MTVDFKNAPRGRVVTMGVVAEFLNLTDHARLTIALKHLSAQPTMLEIEPNYWVTVQKVKSPPSLRKGPKVLVMTRRGGK